MIKPINFLNKIFQIRIIKICDNNNKPITYLSHFPT